MIKRATTRSIAVRVPSIGAKTIRNSSIRGKSSKATEVMACTLMLPLKVQKKVPVSYMIKKNRFISQRKMSRKK